MTLDEVRKALARIHVPSFVKSITASSTGFNEWPSVQREYRLLVELANLECDVYREGETRKPLSNHPFDLPADEDALRGQVSAAVVMACAHETLEQVTDGGQHFCDPHGFKAASDLDTFQWLTLLDTFHGVVRQYGTYMPVKG